MPNRKVIADSIPESESSPSLKKSRVNIHLTLAPGTNLEVSLDATNERGEPIESKVVRFHNDEIPISTDQDTQETFIKKAKDVVQAGKQPEWLAISLAWLKRTWERVTHSLQFWYDNRSYWLFIGALLIYLLTRLIALESFPIYFFTDEAVQTVLAQDFIRDSFTNYDHEVFPTYFVNGNQYNLGTSVYFQVIPLLIFGKSIFITRGTSVLITLLAAISVGLIMKRMVKSDYPWLAILVLSITPAWFLHSRTAFETALAVTFYALFLFCYLQYRQGSVRFLYAAVGAGALCFYSYSPAQMVMAVSAILLLISDARYHWQQRKYILRAFGIAVLLALPYIRFLIAHGSENIKHLQILQSYWLADLMPLEKLQRYLTQYIRGLNPVYWFLPNEIDFSRHVMDGYGHLLKYSLPFFGIGLLVAIRNFRSFTHRALLIALVAAPSGAALVELGITRALFMVIPASMITALGLDAVLRWLKKIRISKALLSGVVFVGLAGFNFYLLNDAVVNGPMWSTDYGLGGMQYGARQLYAEVGNYLSEDPKAHLIISPSWANGADVVARFFYDDPQPFQLGSIDGYMIEKKELKPNTVFIMTPDELARVMPSPKFKNIHVIKTLPYPNAEPGFYFVTLDYSDDIDSILEAEISSRSILNETSLTLADGTQVQAFISTLDMGSPENLVDTNFDSVARTAQANPMKIQVIFPEPHRISGVTVRVGGTPTEVTVYPYELSNADPFYYSMVKDETPDPRNVNVVFDKPLEVVRVDIEVKSTRDGEPAHVHVWEIQFNQP